MYHAQINSRSNMVPTHPGVDGDQAERSATPFLHKQHLARPGLARVALGAALSSPTATLSRARALGGLARRRRHARVGILGRFALRATFAALALSTTATSTSRSAFAALGGASALLGGITVTTIAALLRLFVIERITSTILRVASTAATATGSFSLGGFR